MRIRSAPVCARPERTWPRQNRPGAAGSGLLDRESKGRARNASQRLYSPCIPVSYPARGAAGQILRG